MGWGEPFETLSQKKLLLLYFLSSCVLSQLLENDKQGHALSVLGAHSYLDRLPYGPGSLSCIDLSPQQRGMSVLYSVSPPPYATGDPVWRGQEVSPPQPPSLPALQRATLYAGEGAWEP